MDRTFISNREACQLVGSFFDIHFVSVEEIANFFDSNPKCREWMANATRGDKYKGDYVEWNKHVEGLACASVATTQ